MQKPTRRTWLTLTDDDDGESVYIQIAHIEYIRRRKSGSIIAFHGGDDDYICVTQSPGEIALMIDGSLCSDE
jgi:hypothetical protein